MWQSWFVLFHSLSQQPGELDHQPCEAKPEKLSILLGSHSFEMADPEAEVNLLISASGHRDRSFAFNSQ